VNRTLARCFGVLLLAVAVTLALVYRDRLDAAALNVWVSGAGAAGPLLFIGLYALATVLFLPGAVLTLAGGEGLIQKGLIALALLAERSKALLGEVLGQPGPGTEPRLEGPRQMLGQEDGDGEADSAARPGPWDGRGRLPCLVRDPAAARECLVHGHRGRVEV